MNKDEKPTSPSVVNELQECNGFPVCRKRSLLQILRGRTGSPSTSMPEPLQVDTQGLDDDPQQHHQLNNIIAFKHDADCLKIKTVKENESSPTKLDHTDDTTNTAVCNMCCRKDEICANLQNNHTTVLTVSDITRLPSWHIRQILTSVCSRCLVYIGAITESSSKLRMQCEQAMHTQNVVMAPPTPDTSPNNFLQVTTTLLDDGPGHSDNVQQQRNCYAPGYCDNTANELPLPLPISSPSPPPPNLANISFNCMSRSPTPTNVGHNSMLQIHYEQPVSPLNTESGGGGKNSKRSYQRVQNIPVQLICEHCNRAYWRKDYYRKHIRRCGAKTRYTKSLGPSRARSASRLDIDTISVVSEGHEPVANTQNQPRVFRCNLCTVTVENVSKLRQHKRIHLPRFYCDICSSEYTSQTEYDFHRVQCQAKQEVFEKGLENIRNDVSSPVAIPGRRKTRSYSRAASMAPTLASSKVSVAPSKAKTEVTAQTTRKRTRPPKKKDAEPAQKEDALSTITTFVKRNKHLYTNQEDSEDARSSKPRKNSKNLKKVNDEVEKEKEEEIEDENEEEEDDDDAVSQVDTLYSKRLSLTNHWVEEHSISSHSHLSQGDDYTENYMDDIPFRTRKEYDLYLLDRLKIEVRLHSLTCFVPDCKFTCATLNEMMVHDYIYHYKKPWFYCHKCGYCFTSKVFLDYHLDLQNKGRYVCYKCGGHFEYQHQLDRHLIHHNRLAASEVEKHVCHFCDFTFLDEDKLLKHCHYENHNWNERRHKIEIDHSMTITNRVPKRKERKNKRYQVKVLNMALKVTPSKRCKPMEKYRLHLPPHLRLPNRIGQVEFRYPNNPNCVGCL